MHLLSAAHGGQCFVSHLLWSLQQTWTHSTQTEQQVLTQQQQQQQQRQEEEDVMTDKDAAVMELLHHTASQLHALPLSSWTSQILKHKVC
jgi:hypothetical protein